MLIESQSRGGSGSGPPNRPWIRGSWASGKVGQRSPRPLVSCCGLMSGYTQKSEAKRLYFTGVEHKDEQRRMAYPYSCQVCGVPCGSTCPCPRCEALYYCGVKHQRVHWLHGCHQEECSRMALQLASLLVGRYWPNSRTVEPYRPCWGMMSFQCLSRVLRCRITPPRCPGTRSCLLR